MYEVAQAIFLRQFEKTKTLLNAKALNVNTNNLDYTTPLFGLNINRVLRLSSLPHIAVSTNNPKILLLLIENYGAKIKQLDDDSNDKFLSILLNQNFDSNVSTASAIKNINTLYRNGASIPDSAVKQIIVNYHFNPQCRDNLRNIIKKLYILKATDEFLNHVKSNNIKEANRFINTNIKKLYPEIDTLGISAFIDQNYDAGVRGMAILIAAEHRNPAMLEALSQRRDYFQKQTDLALKNSDGVTIFHILARTGNINTLQDVCEKFTPNALQNMLTAQTNSPNRQTPLVIAKQHNNQQIIDFLQDYATKTNDFVFKEVQTEAPMRLRTLKDAGYTFTHTNLENQGNTFHYAILGNNPANLRWIWANIPQNQRSRLLLGKIKIHINGNIALDTPFQLAKKREDQRSVRILEMLAIQLLETDNSITIINLKEAGHLLNCNDHNAYNAIHYAVLGEKLENLIALLNQMPLSQIDILLKQKTLDTNQTPLEMAKAKNLNDIINILEQYTQIADDFNQPNIQRCFLNTIGDFFENSAQNLSNNAQSPVFQQPLFFGNPLMQANQNNSSNNVTEQQKNNESLSQNSKKRNTVENGNNNNNDDPHRTLHLRNRQRIQNNDESVL